MVFRDFGFRALDQLLVARGALIIRGKGLLKKHQLNCGIYVLPGVPSPHSHLLDLRCDLEGCWTKSHGFKPVRDSILRFSKWWAPFALRGCFNLVVPGNLLSFLDFWGLVVGFPFSSRFKQGSGI